MKNSLVADPKALWDQLSAKDKAEFRQLIAKQNARKSIAAFSEYVFKHKPAKHHVEIIKMLEDYPNDNILIIAPPRHAKTTYVGVVYPTYKIAQNPESHILYISSTIEQALKQSLEIRETIQNNDRFKQVVPDVYPDLARHWQKHTWTVKSDRHDQDKDPTFISSGFDGNILGSTADEIIIDDLNDRKNTATPYMRQKVQDWVTRTVLTRLSPKGRVVCIMTRWHADDLAAFFKDNGFKCLEMQAIGCGGCDIDHQHREKNAPLWPGVWDLERLLKTKSQMDVWQWEGVYQGNPTPVGGTIFKEEWWRYYQVDPEDRDQKELEPLPNEFSLKIQSWDTSQKDGEENDWSVCSTWGWTRGNLYLLDVFRDKLEYPYLKKAVIAQWQRHNPGAVLVEDASSGQSLVQELPIDTSIPIIPIKVEHDKVSRARASSPLPQAGRVYLPADAPWLYTWVKEHSDFPQGRWRDQVDSTSQAVTWIRQNTGEDSSFSEASESLGMAKSFWSPSISDALENPVLLGDDWGLSRWDRFN